MPSSRAIDPDVRPEYPSPARIGATLRRWWPAMLVTAAIFGLLADRASKPDATPYKSSAQVLVGPLAGVLSVLRAAGQQAQTYADLATSGPVLTATLRSIGSSETTADFTKRVTVAADSNTRLLKITVKAATPRQAARDANLLARQIVREAQVRKSAIPTATAQPTPSAATTTTALDALGPREQAASVSLRVVENAVPPPGVGKSRTKLFTAVAALAGLLAALALGLVVDIARRRIETEEELDAASPAPGLGSLRGGRVTPAAVARARARDGLLVADGGDASAAPLALAFARALAGQGMPVLLVDADPEGALSRDLGLADRPGLLDALTRDDVDAQPVALARDPWLRVLPLGTRWGSRRPDDHSAPHLPAVDPDVARRALEPLEQPGGAVVVCLGAAPSIAASTAWLPEVGAVVGARRGTARAGDVADAVAVLARHGRPVVGTVLVRGRRGRLRRRRRAAAGPRAGLAPVAEARGHQPA